MLRRASSTLGAAVAAVLLAAAPAVATTFTVTGGADGTGDCTPPSSGVSSCTTLRAAVTFAQDDDEITLPARTYTVSGGELPLARDIVIIGAGTRDTVIQRSGTGRLFTVTAHAELDLVTLTGGDAGTGDGGDILDSGVLSLEYVHVTNGHAANGGGVMIVGPGQLEMITSLVDQNVATGSGGGIALTADPDADQEGFLSIGVSTIANNQAPVGAGISSSGNTANLTQLYEATVARNAGSGVYAGDPGTVRLNGSIVANDAGPNCAGASPTDLGGNIEDRDDCGLGRNGVASLANRDPLLAGAVANLGGFTDVLAIGEGSPAIDLVNPCLIPYDQRLVLRVTADNQPCDAGAYERAGATITNGPSGTTSSGTATFTFSTADTGVTYECSLTGPGHSGAYEPCTSPKTYTGLAPGPYTFSVRTVDSSGTPTSIASRQFAIAAPAQQTPTPTPSPTPTPTPTPVPGQSVVVQPVSGRVLVRRPGSNQFVELDGTQGIPLGSTLDTKNGAIELTAIGKGGKLEKAKFYDGIFKITQSGATTDLTLNEPLAPCGKGAHPSAKKSKSRKLWGDGSGSFRTRGQYSAATVRGTQWLVQDTCAGTLTKVKKGVVSVRDNVKRKTILLKAGKQYLAKARSSG